MSLTDADIDDDGVDAVWDAIKIPILVVVLWIVDVGLITITGVIGSLFFSASRPRLKKNIKALPRTTKKIGSAINGILILNSNVVVCLFFISWIQASNFRNGLLIVTDTIGLSKIGSEAIWLSVTAAPTIFVEVVTASAGGVLAGMKRPSPSRAWSFCSSFCFSSSATSTYQ